MPAWFTGLFRCCPKRRWEAVPASRHWPNAWSLATCQRAFDESWPKWCLSIQSINSFILASAFIGIFACVEVDEDAYPNVFQHSLFWAAIAFAVAILTLALLSPAQTLAIEVGEAYEEAIAMENRGIPHYHDAWHHNKLLRARREAACVHNLIQAALVGTAIALGCLAAAMSCFMMSRTQKSDLGIIATALIVGFAVIGIMFFLVPYFFYATRPETPPEPALHQEMVLVQKQPLDQRPQMVQA